MGASTPNDIWYLENVRPDAMYRMVSGEVPELILQTEGGNGMTLVLEERLVQCGSEGNRSSHVAHDDTVSTLVDRFEGRRFNRQNFDYRESGLCLLFVRAVTSVYTSLLKKPGQPHMRYLVR